MKTTRTQNDENTLEQLAWADGGLRKRQDEDSSYPKGFEILLRETTKRNCPNAEDVDNPKIAPQDYDVRQSERDWEFQNRDFWIRPTDLSLHFPILVTIREMPLKHYRGRSSEKSMARENKIEEAKKQKTKRSDDKWSCAEWQTSSWSWQQSMTWTASSSSSWHTNWQSADWESKDEVQKTTVWQSHFSGQWDPPHRSLQRHPWRRK